MCIVVVYVCIRGGRERSERGRVSVAIRVGAVACRAERGRGRASEARRGGVPPVRGEG